jgi:hypothetical protein
MAHRSVFVVVDVYWPMQPLLPSVMMLLELVMMMGVMIVVVMVVC